MKRIVLLILTLLMTLSAFAQSPKSIYNKYSDEKGVSAVFISQSMFKLLGAVPDFEVGNADVDISSIIKELTGMYIIDTENIVVKQKLFKDVTTYVNNADYDLLLEAKDDGEVVRMYTTGDEKNVTGFVLLAHELDEITFIGFEGVIPRDVFEATMAISQVSD